jgi:DNA invertase Pin-like site-specific DNA recombinase
MKCPKCGHEFEIEKSDKNRGDSQKKGMIKKFSEGKHMSRAPFGYEWNLKEKILVPAQNSKEVEEIFEEFLQLDMSLSKLAEKHNFSVNGLKKVLRNFAYVGKVKFDGQIHEGKHLPLLSTTLFNHVQDKLDKLEKKK